MKKCLLLVALSIVSQLNTVTAQPLFHVQDTVCVGQPVHIINYQKNASTYFWGFCSGYVLDQPVGTNMGNPFGLKGPGDICVQKDNSGNYYGFVTNSGSKELLRLNFGLSLSNTPTVTNFGNLTNVLPSDPTSVFLVKDTTNWFLFVTAGTNTTNSALARIDFGPTLDNPRPNIVNFGNQYHTMNGPCGFFAAQETDGRWYGYLVNKTSSELIKLNFANNISNTPLLFNEGNLGGVLGTPSDLTAVFSGHDLDQASFGWHLFITNLANGSLARVDLGNYLNNASSGVNLGNINGFLSKPSSISITRDCGSFYAFITDTVAGQFVRINMPTVTGPYTAFDYGNIGNLNEPTGLSGIIRDHDNVYAFATNQGDSTLSRIVFEQCHHATIPSSLDSIPPVYAYDTAGIYNIYFEENSGLPTMVTQCKTITVLPIPPINLTNDTTLCQGDTIHIHTFSDNVVSYVFSPDYNVSDTLGPDIKVFPAFSQTYNVVITYPNGCIVDTSIKIHISKSFGDAGPDRTIADGATTILGGTTASPDSNYTYEWFPTQFVSNPTILNPTARPTYDFTYYLKITEHNDTFKCSSIDTVVVHVRCNDLTLPNAFVPGSTAGGNRFGLLNQDIIKLNYLRVYDRWGEEVFETADPTEKWDGTINGKLAPFGVYVWEADGFCQSGLHFRKSGNVTLIR